MPNGLLESQNRNSSLLSPVMALFGLSLRQHLRGKRIWVLVVLFLLPAVLALLLRCLENPPPTDTLEFSLIFNLLPHALAPLAALLFASGMIQDEVEEQTLTYLLLRPMHRGMIYAIKFLAALTVTSMLICVGILLLYIVIYVGSEDAFDINLTARFLNTVFIFCLGQAAYCALFGMLMLFTRRSLLLGVAYILFVEGMVSNIPFVVRRVTIVYYTRILALDWLEFPSRLAANWNRRWQLTQDDLPTGTEAALIMGGSALLLLLLSAWRFNRMEFSMKTPDGN